MSLATLGARPSQTEAAAAPVRRLVWPTIRLLALVCALVVLMPEAARAYRRRGPAYRLYNWRGRVAAEVRNDREIRTSNRRPKSDITEWLVSEELKIGADGWVYHPALLRFSIDLGLVFDQDFVETSGDSDLSQVDGTQESFDVNLQVLPDKPYPLSLFASQVHSEINSAFAARRTIDTLQYGAGLVLRELAVGQWETPARVLYRHLDTSTNGQFGTDRVSDEIEVTVDNESDRARNRLEYDWTFQESGGDQNTRVYQRHHLRLSQELQLSRAWITDGRLSSQLVATDTSDDFSARAVSLDEALKVQHSRMLSSNYGYGMNFQDSGSNRQLSNRVYVGLSHQLYQSLNSSFTLSGAYTDSDLGAIVQADGAASFNYTKKIPWGRFGLRFSPVYAYQDEDLESGILTILGERIDVVIGIPLALNKLNVVESSIVVRDAKTNALFSEGVDYSVVVENRRTFLVVNPFGNIDAQSTPLLSVRYDYLREPARRFSTLTMVYGGNLQLFDHWTADVSYSDTNQTLLKGDEVDSTLSDEQRLLASLNAVFGRNHTRLEYEKTESEITPRERYSVTHNVSFRPVRRATVGMSAGYAHDRIVDTGRTSDVYSFDTNTTLWLPYRILGRLGLLVRYLDEEEQSTLVQGTTMSLTFHYGRIRLQLQERFSWDDVNNKVAQGERVKELVNTVSFRVERTY